MKRSLLLTKTILILLILCISLGSCDFIKNLGSKNPTVDNNQNNGTGTTQPGGDSTTPGGDTTQPGGTTNPGGDTTDPGGNITPEPAKKNNFASLETAEFKNINGKTVTVDSFMRSPNQSINNPNAGQGIMIYQCIKYKEAHPEADVRISFTSFRISVVAAVCLDRESDEFSLMKALYDSDYDDKGYVRISYLLVYAAKIGIDVTVIGHLNASDVKWEDGNYRSDYSFIDYFNSHLEDESTIAGKKVGDFMLAKKVYWTAYGDKAASDMMHVKSCTVSNYIDKDGNECGPAIWVGSTNLDGINFQGHNGHNGLQTAVIVANHEEIRRVIYNYTMLMTNYCEQEQIAEFRALIRDMNQKQIDLIKEGKADQIPADEAIVYIGGENDPVFEFYLTPLGGAPGTWDAKYNPYSKYISKLLPATSGSDYIVFAWNNVKYYMTFEFSQTLVNVLKNAFTRNTNEGNKLYLQLPGLDETYFDELVAGENIDYISINQHPNQHHFHNKDFQLSYVENGERYYVSVLNSLNFHQGAMNYQTNSILVVKETEETGNNVYVALGKDITGGCITEADRIPAKD